MLCVCLDNVSVTLNTQHVVFQIKRTWCEKHKM